MLQLGPRQVGCFNHGVVTMAWVPWRGYHGVVILAAYKLEIRDSDYERFALI